jgi:hypothetical protein
MASRVNAIRSRLGTAGLDALCVVAIAGCVALLLRDGLLWGVIFYERDTFLFYEPLNQWYREQLRAGLRPSWMPDIFGGYALFADGELGMLYPTTVWLLPILPDWIAVSVIRTLHLTLAGAGMFALLRIVGRTRLAATLGGVTFCLGSFLVTQLHHENMIRSASWLPAVLACVELSFRRGGWWRQRWLALAGLFVGVAALGVHVQAVLMTLVAVALYAGVRLVVGPIAADWRERLALVVWTPTMVGALGVAIGLVQWLPLLELGRTSYRGPGLGYDLASTWPLRWQNLPTLLYPYLFRLEDGRHLTLWQQWETLVYVGIAPLVLAGVGTLFALSRSALPFAFVAGGGLVIGLADQSPFNLHFLLWHVPGFSSLRAPGRYSLLLVFGLAGLAAHGLDWLRCERRSARWVGVCAALVVASAAIAVWLPGAIRSRLLANPARWASLLEQNYVGARHEHEWLKLDLLREHLVRTLSYTEPRTALSMVLLGITALLVVIGIRHRLREWTALGLVLLSASDLLAFGRDFHPRESRAVLLRPAPVTQALARIGGRTLPDVALTQSNGVLEPNRLLYAGVSSVSGYSSLQSQRHFEFLSNVAGARVRLLDWWAVDNLVTADPPRDIVVFNGLAYRPYASIFNGAIHNLTGIATFEFEPTETVGVRILSTLIDGVEIEQGRPTLVVRLFDRSGGTRDVTLLAGIHIAENAFDRADVRPFLRHQKPPIGTTVPDVDPAGLPTRTNVYLADLPIDPATIWKADLIQVEPRGQSRVFTFGMVRPDGSVRTVFARDELGLDPVWHGDGLVILRNLATYPRAYVVPEVIARRDRSEISALPRLLRFPFDANRQAIFEEGPFDGLPVVQARPGKPLEPTGKPRGARVEDIAPDHVRVHLEPDMGGVLVLTDSYHRGWRATIDGRPAHVYIANFLFRGVQLLPGDRVVDFRFDPLSHRVGWAVSAAALACVSLIVLASLLPRRRPVNGVSSAKS